MNGIGEYLDVHSTALEVRARRNKILASNIANAATPHFKARDIDFQDEIRRACLLYTSPSPRDLWISRMPSSA